MRVDVVLPMLPSLIALGTSSIGEAVAGISADLSLLLEGCS
jgi:hypothetical protein